MALIGLLALAVLSIAAVAVADRPDASSGPTPEAAGDDVINVRIFWNFGSDRRGRIDVHACSNPRANTTSNGDCYVSDIVNTQLLKFEGDTSLRMVEGNEYSICFVALDTVGRPGTWGACRLVTAQRDARYDFTSADMRYWYGGPWNEP